MTLNHEEVKQELDALFVGDALASPLEVRGHLGDCARCRGYFEELAAIERALGDGASDEVAFEHRYTEAIMSAALRDRRPTREAGLVAAITRALGALSPRALAPAAVALALVAGASVALVRGLDEGPGAPEEAFTPRIGVAAPVGGAMPPRAGVHRVEIFCVQRGEGGIQIKEAEADALECGLGDEVKFAFINAPIRGEQALPWLTLVGLDEEGEVRWYHPVEPGAGGIASMKVGPSSRIKLLGETIRLEVNHKTGLVVLHAIFSATPMRRDAVASRLKPGQSAPGFDGLPLRDERGHSVVMGARGSGEYVVSSHLLKIVAQAGEGPRGDSP